MELLIEVTYTALFFDNHQGGSGKVFSDRVLFEIEDTTTAVQIVDKAFAYIEKVNDRHFVGEVKLNDIKFVFKAN